jgi:hypothetical protein
MAMFDTSSLQSAIIMVMVLLGGSPCGRSSISITLGRVDWPPTTKHKPHKAYGHYIRLSQHDPIVYRVDLVSHHKKKINQQKQNKMAKERGIGRGVGRITGRRDQRDETLFLASVLSPECSSKVTTSFGDVKFTRNDAPHNGEVEKVHIVVGPTSLSINKFIYSYTPFIVVA